MYEIPAVRGKERMCTSRTQAKGGWSKLEVGMVWQIGMEWRPERGVRGGDENEGKQRKRTDL